MKKIVIKSSVKKIPGKKKYGKFILVIGKNF